MVFNFIESRWFWTVLFVLGMVGCGSATSPQTGDNGGKKEKVDSPKTEKPGGSTSSKPGNSTSTDAYAHIPKSLNDAEAVRFLNKATFGASEADIKALKEKGVIKWLDEQLSLPMEKDIYLKKMIRIAKQAEPDAFDKTEAEYLADNDVVFNKEKASFHSPRYRLGAWFDLALTADDQLRHKVTYALSQIIVESDFEPIFIRRAEGLARYFDVLYQNAFGSYKDLLEDISFNSGMGLFLTFNGNQKVYENKAGVSVYPDENYAREIMQLFSIGLNKLNLDGTPQKDTNGNLIPTYTQQDVNELARVFTGWDLKRNSRFGRVGFTQGDLTHPLEFTKKYHDFGEKEVLGEKIPADLSGEEDIKKAVDIIFSQPSVAPYISKNLIMRLTKSNPSPAYVERVATVFQSSGGDLKEVVKAILLDAELWDDLKANRSIKFKEPLVAYTQFLRAMKTKPLPSWYFCKYGGPADDSASNCTQVKNSFLFNDTRSYLGEGPGLAPTVFNFYDNDFVPNDDAFKSQNLVAPEVQIQSDTMLINFSNHINNEAMQWEEGYWLERSYKDKNGVWHRYKSIEEMIAKAPMVNNVPVYYVGRDKFLLDASAEYAVLEQVIDGDSDGDFEKLQDYRETEYTDDEKALEALIAYENKKLTGGMLTKEQESVIYNALKDKIYNKYADQGDNPRTKKYQLYQNVIVPVIRAIVTSDAYMVE